MREDILYTQNNTAGRITTGPAYNPHHEQTSERYLKNHMYTIWRHYNSTDYYLRLVGTR
jgi:hypothetical protein